MTNRQMDNRVKKLQEIEAQIKALEEQADAIQEELKAELEAQGEDEHHTGRFIIRWKEIVGSRLDGKALKAAFPDIARQFTRQTSSRRFTIA